MNIEEKYNKLIYWFKEISKIPRNSTQEEKIAKYLCNFAKERNLEYKQDELYNVLIKKKASKGYEEKDAIIFQAHTDMVCEKTSDSTHDFQKDEIEIIETEETLKAKDTTLGADDGIGVATLLLLLDDDEIEHPTIYCLFTTQEEIGMDGAKYFDYSGIDAKYLINVDGEEENTAIVGCAGGVRVCYNKDLELVNTTDKIYNIRISGLHGGHSGVDIDKGRLNSNYLVAQVLNRLENVKIISFIGGNKDNAIPNDTNAVFSTTSNNIKEVINEVLKNTKILEDDKNLKIDIEEDNTKQKAITQEESKKILDLLINLKQGVIEYSKDVEKLVETSGNIGVVKVLDGKISITELIRSSDDEQKEIVKKHNNTLAQNYGYSVLENSSYPGWKYKPNSIIEKAFIESYKEVHSQQEPIVCAIHAGVECGMIYKKMPHLELISIGPDIVDVHTVNETLFLKSCKNFLNTLIKLINKL
ncbi:MAG: beta-Ala-His dipeptidase [Clostridia bacterium]|nr:beta-Ala-His dipeptidase [Clostridia bacterium]